MLPDPSNSMEILSDDPSVVDNDVVNIRSINNFSFLPLTETYSVAFKLSTDKKL